MDDGESSLATIGLADLESFGGDTEKGELSNLGPTAIHGIQRSENSSTGAEQHHIIASEINPNAPPPSENDQTLSSLGQPVQLSQGWHLMFLSEETEQKYVDATYAPYGLWYPAAWGVAVMLVQMTVTLLNFQADIQHIAPWEYTTDASWQREGTEVPRYYIYGISLTGLFIALVMLGLHFYLSKCTTTDSSTSSDSWKSWVLSGAVLETCWLNPILFQCASILVSEYHFPEWCTANEHSLLLRDEKVTDHCDDFVDAYILNTFVGGFVLPVRWIKMVPAQFIWPFAWFFFRPVSASRLFFRTSDAIIFPNALLILIPILANEYRSRKQFITGELLRNEVRETVLAQEAINRILVSMLPPSVLARIIKGKKHISDKGYCSVVYSDVANFTTWCSERRAIEVVEMLNTMYSLFDKEVKAYGVMKVKTVGDAYWAACGIPTPCRDHILRICGFAKYMIGAVKLMNGLQPEDGDDDGQRKKLSARNLHLNAERLSALALFGATIKIRVGVHTGLVCAGLIGDQQSSYDLFGTTNEVAEQMEQQAPLGQILLSESAMIELAKISRAISHGASTKMLHHKRHDLVDTSASVTTFGTSVVPPTPNSNKELMVDMSLDAYRGGSSAQILDSRGGDFSSGIDTPRDTMLSQSLKVDEWEEVQREELLKTLQTSIFNVSEAESVFTVEGPQRTFVLKNLNWSLDDLSLTSFPPEPFPPTPLTPVMVSTTSSVRTLRRRESRLMASSDVPEGHSGTQVKIPTHQKMISPPSFKSIDRSGDEPPSRTGSRLILASKAGAITEQARKDESVAVEDVEDISPLPFDEQPKSNEPHPPPHWINGSSSSLGEDKEALPTLITIAKPSASSDGTQQQESMGSAPLSLSGTAERSFSVPPAPPPQTNQQESNTWRREMKSFRDRLSKSTGRTLMHTFDDVATEDSYTAWTHRQFGTRLRGASLALSLLTSLLFIVLLAENHSHPWHTYVLLPVIIIATAVQSRYWPVHSSSSTTTTTVDESVKETPQPFIGLIAYYLECNALMLILAFAGRSVVTMDLLYLNSNYLVVSPMLGYLQSHTFIVRSYLHLTALHIIFILLPQLVLQAAIKTVYIHNVVMIQLCIVVWIVTIRSAEIRSRTQFVEEEIRQATFVTTTQKHKKLASLLERMVPHFIVEDITRWFCGPRTSYLAASFPMVGILFLRVPAIKQYFSADADPEGVMLFIRAYAKTCDSIFQQNSPHEPSKKRSDFCVKLKLLGDIIMIGSGLQKHSAVVAERTRHERLQLLFDEAGSTIKPPEPSNNGAEQTPTPPLVSTDAGQHLKELVSLALELSEQLTRQFGSSCGASAGMHCGPCTAGVIGNDRLIYDVFGDTVNTASRVMSTSGDGIWMSTEMAAATSVPWTPTMLVSAPVPRHMKGKGMMEVVNVAWNELQEDASQAKKGAEVDDSSNHDDEIAVMGVDEFGEPTSLSASPVHRNPLAPRSFH